MLDAARIGLSDYQRVIPRDLFNEGNLLTCLGRLWIKLEAMNDPRVSLSFVDEGGAGFDIEQDQGDGSISCPTVRLMVACEDVHLFRPLNARAPWPLWARMGDDDVRVFDEAGELSSEFHNHIADPRAEHGLSREPRRGAGKDSDGVHD
jgi:hypothetical protein